ncbi:MAG: hypothetical protein KC413_09450 [Anaerolineales bacterium]|nr:hypothetical protein [Anaerolineales bacterium]
MCAAGGAFGCIAGGNGRSSYTLFHPISQTGDACANGRIAYGHGDSNRNCNAYSYGNANTYCNSNTLVVI